jgi:hypothetical protein
MYFEISSYIYLYQCNWLPENFPVKNDFPYVVVEIQSSDCEVTTLTLLQSKSMQITNVFRYFK